MILAVYTDLSLTAYMVNSCQIEPFEIMSRRKSVRGLHMDFVILNSLGFLCYGIFNVSIFFIPSVQQAYRALHHTSEIPVQLNDVVFTLHATAACLITLAQCFLYEKDDQAKKTN